MLLEAILALFPTSAQLRLVQWEFQLRWGISRVQLARRCLQQCLASPVGLCLPSGARGHQ